MKSLFDTALSLFATPALIGLMAFFPPVVHADTAPKEILQNTGVGVSMERKIGTAPISN